MATSPWRVVPENDTSAWKPVPEEAPPGVPAAPQPKMETVLNPLPGLQAIGDFGRGILKGGENTLRGIGNLEAKIPGLRSMLPADVQSFLGPEGEAMAAPQGTAQKIGYGGEQVGEFLVPGSLEEKGATKLATLLPKLGRFAEPAAKVAAGALSSGAVNTAQGGSPVAGALMGGGGKAVGLGLKAVAPTLTGIAQGLKPEDYGKTGSAILNGTRGILPGSIRSSARGVLDTLNPQLDAAAQAATTPVPLAGPRQVAEELTNRAFGQNEPKMYKGVKRMANLVNQDLAGNPLPNEVTPYQALELKRGIGKAQPKGSWNPESSNAFKGPRTTLYNALNEEFLKAVPEAGPLNQRISALIPATERPKNFFFGHALGPGVGATLGGVGGYRRGVGPEGTDIATGLKEGALGALGGAAAGYAVPAAMNTGARIAASPFLAPLIRTGTGAVLQTDRKKKEQ